MPVEELLWDFEPHTIAKHQILGRYLNAWAPILGISGFNGQIVYIDGFAGPGEDKSRSRLGSPAIALNLVLKHALAKSMKSEIVFTFIEKRRDRAEYLDALIKSKFPSLPDSIKAEVKREDFNIALKNILDELEGHGRRLAPTFCFVDPFGWDDIDLPQLARFMCQTKAELFITFMVGFLSRFIFDDKHQNSISRIFTPDQIEAAKANSGKDREELLLRFMIQNLKNLVKEKGEMKEIHDISFRAEGSNNQLRYYLIYLTSHEKGMEVMKEAMYSVAKDHSYRFSDFHFDPAQKTLVDYMAKSEIWQAEAANELYSNIPDDLKGEAAVSIPIESLKSHVILRTNWVWRTTILKKLEEKNLIVFVGNRPRRFTYPLHDRNGRQNRVRFLVLNQ